MKNEKESNVQMKNDEETASNGFSGEEAWEEAKRFNRKYDEVTSRISSQLSRIIYELGGVSNIDFLKKEEFVVEPQFRIGTIRKGWSDPIFLEGQVKFYLGRYHPEGDLKELGFFVKSFSKSNNETLELESTPLEREKRLYELMGGSGVVPRAFYWEELGDSLVLEHAGKINAEDKLVNLSKPKKENLEEKIIKVITKFNSHALDMTPEALQDDIIGPWLKVKKPSIDDAIRYFKDYLRCHGEEVNEELVKEFADNYYIIIDMYGENGTQLVHGDLRRQNVVGPKDEEWTEENIKIVDLGRMILGNPMSSLAQFVTSAGSTANYERWNELINTYRTCEASQMGISGGKGIRFLKDGKIKANRKFYSSAIHDSIYGLSKMAKLREERPGEYARLMYYRPVLKNHDRDMKRNIRKASRYILENLQDFELHEPEIARFKKTIEIFMKYAKLK